LVCWHSSDSAGPDAAVAALKAAHAAQINALEETLTSKDQQLIKRDAQINALRDEYAVALLEKAETAKMIEMGTRMLQQKDEAVRRAEEAQLSWLTEKDSFLVQLDRITASNTELFDTIHMLQDKITELESEHQVTNMLLQGEKQASDETAAATQTLLTAAQQRIEALEEQLHELENERVMQLGAAELVIHELQTKLSVQAASAALTSVASRTTGAGTDVAFSTTQLLQDLQVQLAELKPELLRSRALVQQLERAVAQGVQDKADALTHAQELRTQLQAYESGPAGVDALALQVLSMRHERDEMLAALKAQQREQARQEEELDQIDHLHQELERVR
jgi:hypothetical protein